ncbi:hypothetical protein SAMD00019534_018330 [Acytostelium subglobosum LB1]|uniref:hypothetical protein n=1 Tax=Acytostelium subglobosum LB1 TaxID=1410327 RepID=UPI000644CD43|nr:hypothetical protein SAMD00019534_018330 [Acytostelium subglobosum LB1]GAM18658.1 hypothetical protein SAMD00019534_018330 [Acytostelium subglobosum LB1]|eukprot:XP_012757878.1 hypothetical protein SAMD00019534_018330 [Acytostelium subglobosum LB1]
MKHYIVLLIVTITLLNLVDAYYYKTNINDNDRPQLKYRPDGTFKIVQFTDLHYGEQDSYDKLNAKSEEAIIAAENPDFVMFSGDMISGYNKHFYDVNFYNTIWDTLTEPLRKRNLPWAITFGNHDAEGQLNSAQLMNLDRSYNLSLNNEPASLIYSFDSDTYACEKDERWGCIHPAQVEWYQNQSTHYNMLPAIAFVHVPPVEMIDLWNNHEVVGDFGDNGVCCYYSFDSKFVSTMVERKDIKGLYFGHDHRNDFVGDYYGVQLGYGRKTGYGSYDPKYPEGARVFLLNEKPYNFTTWIRNVHGQVETQRTHKPHPQDPAPSICCVPLDHTPYFAIYLGVFGFIMIVLFLTQRGMFRTSPPSSPSGSGSYHQLLKL